MCIQTAPRKLALQSLMQLKIYLIAGSTHTRRLEVEPTVQGHAHHQTTSQTQQPVQMLLTLTLATMLR